MGLRLSDYLGYYVYFVDGNNVLKSVVVIVTQLCKYTKNKWTHMLCELISAKLFYEKFIYKNFHSWVEEKCKTNKICQHQLN